MGSSLVAQMVKNPPAMQETWVLSLCLEDPLEKRITLHSSILGWSIPWTEEPGGLHSILLQRVRHNWALIHTHTHPVLCLVPQPCLTLCDPVDCSPSGSSVHEDSAGKSTGVGYHALLRGIFPTPGIEPRSPTMQVDSLPSEPPGKPMNTGVGSLSLLQGIFLTQELRWGLLHCRRILYQLNYQGSPPTHIHTSRSY